MAALLDAVESLRQHPEQSELHHAALRKAHAAILAATTQGPLHIGLCPADGSEPTGGDEGNRLQLVDELVRTSPAPGQRSAAPFAPLQAAGVGDVVLLPGITAAELHRLAGHLAATSAGDDPEQAVRRLQRDPALANVQLRTAATCAIPAPSDEALDWTALPTVAAPSPELASLVARDLASNLPALVARQLLDDLAAQPAASGRTLVQLLHGLLDRDDLVTASWLLAEVTQEAPGLADQLRQLAAARADDRWLQRWLTNGTRDELTQLCTFVMQLPDEVPLRFAERLAATAHPQARWLRALLA